ALRRWSVSLRDALLRHRWAVGVMEARMRPGPANLVQHNAMMGCLRRSGFSFRTTVHVTSVLDAYVYGFALQEKTLPFEPPEASGREAVGMKSSTLALSGLILAVSMTTIDQTIVALSAPSIQQNLGLTHDGMQWAVNVYLLTTAACFLLGGRVADVIGHKR